MGWLAESILVCISSLFCPHSALAAERWFFCVFLAGHMAPVSALAWCTVTCYDPSTGALYGTRKLTQIIRIDGLAVQAAPYFAAEHLSPVLTGVLPGGVTRIIAEYAV